MVLDILDALQARSNMTSSFSLRQMPILRQFYIDDARKIVGSPADAGLELVGLPRSLRSAPDVAIRPRR
jgi:hypothetical protein